MHIFWADSSGKQQKMLSEKQFSKVFFDIMNDKI